MLLHFLFFFLVITLFKKQKQWYLQETVHYLLLLQWNSNRERERRLQERDDPETSLLASALLFHRLREPFAGKGLITVAAASTAADAASHLQESSGQEELFATVRVLAVLQELRVQALVWRARAAVRALHAAVVALSHHKRPVL